jgi:hypothetical protein
MLKFSDNCQKFSKSLKRRPRLCHFAAMLLNAGSGKSDSGRLMSGQVVLYFEDQSDALRFALAAGSVMAGEGIRATNDLVHETARVTRIRLDDANKEKSRQPDPSDRVA